MKYTIDTNSWHFWVACFLNDESGVRHKKTICSYRWSVIFGLLRLFLMTVIALLAFLLPLCVTTLHYFLPKVWSKDTVFLCSTVNAIEVGVFFAIILALQIYKWYEARKERKCAEKLAAQLAGTWKEPEVKKKKAKEPGFVKTAWRSLKDKYCLPIDFD